MLYFHCTVKSVHTMKEQNLVAQIEKKLPQLLPEGFELRSFSNENNLSDRRDIDLLATITHKMSPKKIRLAIEVKYGERQSAIILAAHQVKMFAMRTDTTPMVASKFLGERLREVLKQEEVNYIDLAGNFYLNLPNMYAEKIVDKNPFTTKLPLKNLFAPVSSRIIRTMLLEPNKDWYLSDLAREAEVSVGQTFKVLNALLDEGYAEKMDNLWRVKDRTALLDAWKDYYPSYETKKYSFYSYSVNNLAERVQRAAEDSNLEYTLGFFSGADLVAPYVRHQGKVQFYTTEDQVSKWADSLDLKRVNSGGNVEIFVPYDKGVFFGKQHLPPGYGDFPVVSNIQLYLDLINDPARGEEAANHIREERIGF